MVVRRVPGRWRGSFRLVGYDAAQICVQGHIISMYAETDPEKKQDHCVKCGAATVMTCSHCEEPIRGYLHQSGETSSLRTPPSFCHKCGKPYPWMEDRLQTAKELLYHDDKLSFEEREKLWNLLKYVMSDPKSDMVPAKKKLIDINVEKAAAGTKDFVQTLLAKLGAEMLKP